MSYKEIKGDLISLTNQGFFDVVGHGVNCHSAQLSGLAPLMVEAFGTDRFHKEKDEFTGQMNKLGTIDGRFVMTNELGSYFENSEVGTDDVKHKVMVLNCYTQYNPGANGDYEALILCMRKINYIFKGKRIGLPKIGCGIAGLDWNKVKKIIQDEMVDVDVTIVILPQ